ncbi:helix-turn-helix domain-containing protein [Sphingomonas oryzagri]
MISPFENYALGARKIILAAEELIAARGYEGTSQREILRAAGQANKSAIRHHFGTKDALVREIFYIRQGEIDEHRRRRMAQIELAGADSGALMGLMLLPILDAFQGRAREIFANFVLQLMLSTPQTSMFGIEYEAPVTREIRLALRVKHAHLPDDIFTMRLSLAVVLFLQGIVQYERLSHDPHRSYVSNAYFWDELFGAALAVFNRDFPPDSTVT